MAALPSTDPQSSGGNISINIWPAAAPSGYPVSQKDANAQESYRLGATSSLSSDMPLTPNTAASRRLQMDGLEKDSQVDSGILGCCLSIPGKAQTRCPLDMWLMASGVICPQRRRSQPHRQGEEAGTVRCSDMPGLGQSTRTLSWGAENRMGTVG